MSAGEIESVDDGVSLYSLFDCGLVKFTGSSSYQVPRIGECICIDDDYVYTASYYGTTVYKISKSDLSTVASITTIPAIVVCNISVNGNDIFVFHANGTVSVINKTTFIEPYQTITFNTGLTYPELTQVGEYIYIMNRDSQSCIALNTTTKVWTEIILGYAHNCVSVDSENNRLIFYTNQIGEISLKPVEIVNNPLFD